MSSRRASASSSEARSRPGSTVRRGRGARPAWGFALAAALLAGPAPAAFAKVFYSRQQAITLAFPDADRVEKETFVLTPEQTTEIEEQSRSQLESKLVTIWTGYRGDDVLGYAHIDVHTVRTQPEAFMVVLDPSGRVRSVRILAFHEPLDYLPTDRWYAQFGDKSLASPLRVGGDVHGVVGATLSARATTSGVRRVLAYYEVLIENGRR